MTHFSRLIYVAGPYRAATPAGIAANIRKAQRLATRVWKAGATAIVPHLNSQFMDGLVPDQAFLDGYLELLSRCDAVLLVKGWHDSEGTLAEIAFAEKFEIAVFHEFADLVRWLRLGALDNLAEEGQKLNLDY